MIEKLTRWGKLFLPIILLVTASLLFLPKLGQTSLRSWDEAWYAEIARNILKSNNWFLLNWNNLPYYDHPPFGFWLIAFSFKIFGISEFSARLPSAICGILSILLIFDLGRILFNKNVGFFSGIILATMPWFWLRSREGDLDIFLIFLILLCFWTAQKIKTRLNYFPLVAFILALILLTKTVIGIFILPALVILLYPDLKKIGLKTWVVSFFIFFVTLLPWYVINFLNFGLVFINRNVFVTGLRQVSYNSLFSSKESFGFYPKFNLQNLQNGISLWFKPFLVSIVGSLLFLKKKSFQFLFAYLLVYLGLFFTSQKTELWHFIIIYPAIALLIPAFISNFLEVLLNNLKNQKRSMLIKSFVTLTALFLLVLWRGGKTVKGLYKDIVKTESLKDEVILSRATVNFKGIIFIDDDYWPAAVYYSEKKIYSLPHSTDTNIKTIPMAFQQSSRPFELITKRWILERDKINPNSYEVIKQVGDRILIRVI